MGIDLLLNFARRQEVGRAEKLIDEVEAGVAEASGWHGWLWNLRMAEARAELALAREDWAEALRWADEAVGQGRARGRRKYEALGLGTRAQALVGMGRTKEAIGDWAATVALARSLRDPAIFLSAAVGLLAVEGDDDLAAEARAAAVKIARALPDEQMRCCFEAAASVRSLR